MGFLWAVHPTLQGSAAEHAITLRATTLIYGRPSNLTSCNSKTLNGSTQNFALLMLHVKYQNTPERASIGQTVAPSHMVGVGVEEWGWVKHKIRVPV
jgi:hypothetical protein